MSGLSPIEVQQEQATDWVMAQVAGVDDSLTVYRSDWHAFVMEMADGRSFTVKVEAVHDA
jgi:hypothetical protein